MRADDAVFPVDSSVRVDSVRTRAAGPFPLSLNAITTTAESSTVAVPKLLSEFGIAVARPTTAAPLLWDNLSTMRVILVVTVDGVEHRCTGQVTGGIRLNKLGEEIPEYTLFYRPTVRRQPDGIWKRLGEDATTVTVKVIFERLSGTIQTSVRIVEYDEQPAPVE